MSESNFLCWARAMQGQWAASKTGVEINNRIEMVYQCHCLFTGRRLRESCDDMDVVVVVYVGPITTWVTKLLQGEERKE